MISFTSKLPNTKTSIFAVMSEVAKKTGAINLSQGFPDFDCDTELQNLVTKYINEGQNQYAPLAGVPSLLEVLSNKIDKLYSVNVHPHKEITITAGATQALYTAISAVINNGDEVIVIEPSYDSYGPAIVMNGGIPIFVSLESKNNFSIPWGEIESKISNKTRMIIVNSPHNPTGAILNKEDIKALEALVEDNDIFVLSDEVYEHITFDGKPHLTVLSSPILRARSMVTYSFGKVLHTTGWKLGYVVAPEILTNEIRKVHQFLVFSCNTPIQHAIAEYYQKEEYTSLPSFFEKKRDLVLSELKASRFRFVPSGGTYFQLLSYAEISNESDVDFAKRISREYKVASIPISAFYHDGRDDKIIRLCFAKSDAMLLKAVSILKTI